MQSETPDYTIITWAVGILQGVYFLAFGHIHTRINRNEEKVAADIAAVRSGFERGDDALVRKLEEVSHNQSEILRTMFTKEDARLFMEAMRKGN